MQARYPRTQRASSHTPQHLTLPDALAQVGELVEALADQLSELPEVLSESDPFYEAVWFCELLACDVERVAQEIGPNLWSDTLADDLGAILEETNTVLGYANTLPKLHILTTHRAIGHTLDAIAEAFDALANAIEAAPPARQLAFPWLDVVEVSP